MKKLLVLAAVIVAGVAANAASFKWTASNIYGSNGTTKWSDAITLYATGSGFEAATEVATFTPTTAGVVNTTVSNTSFAAGEVYSFYFVIEDGDKTFTSVVKTATASDVGSPAVQFGNMASATQSASNWQTVPEPTSGLLMLLGMAGLALKRKRA